LAERKEEELFRVFLAKTNDNQMSAKFCTQKGFGGYFTVLPARLFYC
jgi:hypothetical protein